MISSQPKGKLLQKGPLGHSSAVPSFLQPQGQEVRFFENLVNKKRLAQHLEFSESYINKLMTFGLPHIKSGRAVRFRISEVMAWLERRNP